MAGSPDNEITFHGQAVGQGDISMDEEEIEIFEEGIEEGNGERHSQTNRGSRDKRGFSRMGLPVKPEEFNGNGDWEEYISHFELCAELGNWSEKEKVLALAVRLRGSARSFYINLSGEEKGDYSSLVEQLGQRFGSTRQQNRWLSRFEARKRLPEESVAALGDDLRQMTKRAYPNLGAIAQEALALNQFYKCISLEMKCRCIDRNCGAVAQAVDVVERYEAILGESSDKKRSVRLVGGSVSPTGNQAGDLKKMLKDVIERLEKLETNGSPVNYNSGRQYQIQCYGCNRPGHLIRNCPDRVTMNMNRGSRQGNARPSSQ